MHPHHADDPAGGRIEGCGAHYCLGEFTGMSLKTAVTLRLQQADRPGPLHELDGVVGEPANPLGFGGLFAQLVAHGHDPVKYPLAHAVVLCVRWRTNGVPQSVPDQKAIRVNSRRLGEEEDGP